MKTVTNQGSKIISIGSLILLPGETKPLPTAYEKSETLDFFQERGVVKISESVEEENPKEPNAEPEPEAEPEEEADKSKGSKRGAGKQ